MILESGVQCAHAILGRGMRRDGHRRDAAAEMRIERAHLLDQCIAIHLRHADVGEDDVGPLLEQ